MPCRMKALALWIVAVALPVTALGQAPERVTGQLLVLPARTLSNSCDALFSAAKPDETRGAQLGLAIEAAAAEVEDLRVVQFSEFRSSFVRKPSYRDRVGLGRDYYLLAQEEYRTLRSAEADQHLRKAVEVFDSIYYDLVEPEAMSQVLLLMGVNLVERSDGPAAHLAFKRALMLAPGLRVQKGYYPPAVESALEVACEDVHASLDGMPLSSLDRALGLMTSEHIDWLVFPIVRYQAETGKQQLVFAVLDRDKRSVGYHEEIPLGEATGDAEEASRIVSRWSACASFRTAGGALKEGPGDWTFSGGYEHLIFLRSPTRSLINAWGFSFNTSRYLVPSFGLVAKVQFLNSYPDRFGDMLDDLRSFRLMVGPAFSLSGEWWRIYVVPGAEAHLLGSFRTSTAPGCKFFAPDSQGYSALCDSSDVREYELVLQGGINLSFGGQLFFANLLFLDFSVSGTTYFFPLNRSFDMNFPISFELGGGISF